jgi:integrase
MSRTPKDSRIDSREARVGKKPLPARKKPYWRQINVGVFVGYAKGVNRSAWIARWREGAGYREQRLGAADDYADADGLVCLSDAQAVKAAQALASGKALPAARFYGDGMTVSQALDDYLKWREQDRPHSSANRTDAAALNRHVRPALGSRTVNSLQAGELNGWLLALAKAAPTLRAPAGERKRRAVDLADPDVRRQRRQTANRVWNAFRAALNHAWRDERNAITTDAAWRRVKPLDVAEAGPPRMLEADEISRLINAADTDFRALLRAALLTGARLGELTALRVGDFLPDQGCVILRQGKTGKVLTQPLTDEGVRFFGSVTAGRKRDAVMLTRSSGAPWGRSDHTRPMREAATRAKVPGVSFKVTRATYGKLLLLATQDIELVAKALGHSDSRITRKHYAQYLPNEVAAGVRKMATIGLDDTSVTTIKRARRAKVSGEGR